MTKTLAHWLTSLQQNQALYPDRWHSDTSLCVLPQNNTPLRADKLGSLLWMGWWRDSPPTQDELNAIQDFAIATTLSHWQLVWRQNRGQQPNQQTSWASDPPPPEQWLGREGVLCYEFRRAGGLSPGLFLDQENNRRWVLEQATGQKVLNLFSYTGGFSLAAAKGNAASVTSVDLSGPYLEWSKNNFRHNLLDVEDPRYRFFKWDSREFLRWAQKKSETFDLIICDPPSFARSAKGPPFRIEEDLPRLIADMSKRLSPTGRILFSFNYESWDADQSLQQVQRITKPLGLALQPTPPVPASIGSQGTGMKSYLLVR